MDGSSQARARHEPPDRGGRCVRAETVREDSRHRESHRITAVRTQSSLASKGYVISGNAPSLVSSTWSSSFTPYGAPSLPA